MPEEGNGVQTLDPEVIKRVTREMVEEADKKKRLEECAAGLEALLAKHNCRLVPFNVVQPDGSAVPRVSIQAIPAQ